MDGFAQGIRLITVSHFIAKLGFAATDGGIARDPAPNSRVNR